MLLKRQEKDGLIKAIYDSSNVLASTFNKTTNELTIIFNHGGQYAYSSVSGADYLRLEIAESQGEVFNKYIRKYSNKKLEDVNTAPIIAEATKIKTAENEVLFNEYKERLQESLEDVLKDLMEDEFSEDAFIQDIKRFNEDLEKFQKVL